MTRVAEWKAELDKGEMVALSGSHRPISSGPKPPPQRSSYQHGSLSNNDSHHPQAKRLLAQDVRGANDPSPYAVQPAKAARKPEPKGARHARRLRQRDREADAEVTRQSVLQFFAR